MDYFEEYSKKIRDDEFSLEENCFQDTYVEPHGLEQAQNIIKILQKGTKYKEMTKFESIESEILFLLPFYKMAGITIPTEDAYHLSSAIAKIQSDPKISTCRFWGKIYGMKRSYWILEAGLTDEVIEERRQKKNDSIFSIKENQPKRQYESTIGSEADNVDSNQGQTEAKNIQQSLNENIIRPPIPPLPHSQFKPPVDTPPEDTGTGVNRFIYFATNDPFCEWHELPPATPKHIISSRMIKKALTGDLDAAVTSFIKFAGNEANLLRAMIARISSGGYIAPVGYWCTKKPKDNDDDLAEEEEVRKFIFLWHGV